MFGLLNLMTKRVNDQIVEYATAQSEIARRIWGNWLDPFHACKPVKIRADQYVLGCAAVRNTKHRR
ncbi:hypothetical protein SAMN05421844_10955 [Bosea robiniae]|uniref:Transposase n=2 Tax=Bosea robiniae TaxID=1036780 RepID=A0ABY0P7G2_9HYPH|nr:hypothetical protein SAMN05421844_10955 [Bosea robiniae]